MANIKLTNDAAFEQRDRESARSNATYWRARGGGIADWLPTPGYTFQRGTRDQDGHCRMAGLNAGVDAVIAAALAADVPIPGMTGPIGVHDAKFIFEANPINLRAWCREYAPALVDADAPRMPGALWW